MILKMKIDSYENKYLKKKIREFWVGVLIVTVCIGVIYLLLK